MVMIVRWSNVVRSTLVPGFWHLFERGALEHRLHKTDFACTE